LSIEPTARPGEQKKKKKVGGKAEKSGVPANVACCREEETKTENPSFFSLSEKRKRRRTKN